MHAEVDKGLDGSGFILPEGSLDRVAPVFQPLIAELVVRMNGEFGARLSGLYLYGSIPRGTARVGSSDLDAMVVSDGIDESDRDRIAAVESDLDKGACGRAQRKLR